MKPKHVLVIYMKPQFKIEQETLDTVCSVLDERKVTYTKHERTKDYRMILKNVDLLIVVGGDGTFLLTSQFVTDIPMLGVNSNPQRKEGFLMQAGKDDFAEKIEALLKGKSKIVNITRLQPILNGEPLRPALNEIFMGHKKPYKMARYTLEINGNTELQRSSGVIVSAPMGTYAWAASAGGVKQSLLSKEFQYIVREPYQGTLHVHKLTKGLLTKKDRFTVKAEMPHCIISIDALSEDFAFKKGSTLEIKIAKPLKYVVFDDFEDVPEFGE